MLKSKSKGANHQESGWKDYSRLSDLWVLGSKVPKQWESIFLLKWDHYFNMETWRMLGISAFRPAEFPNQPSTGMKYEHVKRLSDRSGIKRYRSHQSLTRWGPILLPNTIEWHPHPPKQYNKSCFNLRLPHFDNNTCTATSIWGFGGQHTLYQYLIQGHTI